MLYNARRGERMADWITTTEAIGLTHYNLVYLRRLIRSGKVAAVKKGNAWWIDRKALLDYVKSAKKSKDRRRGPRVDRT